MGAVDMAIETHVLFDAPLPSIAALNAELKALGFPVRFQGGHGPLRTQGGFRPINVRGEQSGCEIDIRRGADAVDELELPEGAGAVPCRVSLRWASDESEGAAALCVAAALAALTKGIVLEEQSGTWQGAAEAAAYARQYLGTMSAPPSAKEPGTRPTDIKRYLKTILDQRDDLVLFGRMLVIRPVRHVLRGAFFDRTGERTRFQIWRYLEPLYGHPASVGLDDTIHNGQWKVTDAHFQPLLHDALRHDVFAELGPLTTLDRVAGHLSGNRWKVSARVIALILAGRHGAANALIDGLERRDPSWRVWLREERQLLERDIRAVCAEYHDKEARTVEALKIAPIWEPSPFPAELPEHERESVAEPGFSAGRWPETPPGLLAPLPERPGEVRFSRDYIFRRDLPLLLEPMTAEVGRQAYQAHQELTAAHRLQDGTLLLSVMRPSRAHQSWIDQAPPGADPIRLYTRLLIYGAERMAEIWLNRRALSDEPLSIHSIEVRTKDRRDSIWHGNFSHERCSVTVFDQREAPRGGVTSELPSELCALLALEHPVPGEPDDVLLRMRRLLDGMGYGELDLDRPFDRWW
jgi:hypothetical protein